jgi:hypothetical protein
MTDPLQRVLAAHGSRERWRASAVLWRMSAVGSNAAKRQSARAVAD